MTICEAVIEVVGRFTYVWKGLRSVTVELAENAEPLIVRVCGLLDPVIGFGVKLPMCGPDDPVTENEKTFYPCPSGLITCDVQLAQLVPTVIKKLSCVEDTYLTCATCT